MSQWVCFMLGLVFGWALQAIVTRRVTKELMEREDKLKNDEQSFTNYVNGISSRVKDALDDETIENPRLTRKRSRP